MSPEPTGFELCMPGIVAGLMLAAVVLAMGEVLFPDAFQQVFPHQTFVMLPVVIGAASTVGMMRFFFRSRGGKEKPRQRIWSDDSKKKNSLTSGGTDAQ